MPVCHPSGRGSSEAQEQDGCGQLTSAKEEKGGHRGDETGDSGTLMEGEVWDASKCG